jgi:Domain of Unknown Function with PDB structure (DUF3857)/Transglutaminase-like superfamily
MKNAKAIGGLLFAAGFLSPNPAAADAPTWMHNLVNATVPAHDEKTDAVVLYSEEVLNVQSADKIKRTVRKVYKILRPNGRDHGTVFVSFNQHSKVTSMHGWCIPAQGKDYEVKDKDAMEISLPKIAGSELISDVKDKMFEIPAADPGNIVGFEYEIEESPLVLQHSWDFQGSDPVKDAKFTLQLPAGWEYSITWRNHAEVKPTQLGGNQWQWAVSDVKGIRPEEQMPPWSGVAGEMIVTFYSPGGGSGDRSFKDWRQMGLWYTALARGRRDATGEIKQKVTALTANAQTPADRMAAIAKFVQQDVRYVAIELGIGGIQPHPAAEIFQHRYGDCKDKATLMGAMLKEAGVDSYYVIINSERGSVDKTTPAQVSAFDHAIIAIKLPDGVNDSRLVATVQHPKLGKLLFFDPTDELIPFGELSGALQENYGLLVAPDGGELYQLPKLEARMNGVFRTASATLDAQGNLSSNFEERRMGDLAASERGRMKTVATDKDRVKVVEAVLAQSLANFAVTKAGMANLQDTSQPFRLSYSVAVQRYAKTAGDLLLVRPRLIGIKGNGFLETKEPRQLPVVFDGPRHDTDVFEITMPAGYEVDDLPPPVDMDFSFASYHSKTEASGNKLKYTRTFEIKELSVPMEKMEDLRKFYRVIAGDERNTAVLKPSTAAASAK